ncbi:MAG: SdrD B-like domain-containing protein, partial [Chitinophagales bacterium]
NPSFDAYSPNTPLFTGNLPPNTTCDIATYYLKARLVDLEACEDESQAFAVNVYPSIAATTVVSVKECFLSINVCDGFEASYNGTSIGGSNTIELSIEDESPAIISVSNPAAPSDCQAIEIEQVFDCDAAGLGNFVWEDSNKDGVQDADEMGINGVTVTLLDADGNVLATTVTANHPDTGEAGYYAFTDLQPGTYMVEFAKPEGSYNFSPSNAGTQDSDSNADETSGRTEMIGLSSGEFNSTIDAGFVGSCCSFVPTAKMDLTVCSGQPFELAVMTEGNCPKEVTWSDGTSGDLLQIGALVNNTCEPMEVAFTATIGEEVNCPKQEQTFVVTVLPIPSMNNVTVNKTDCSIVVNTCEGFDIEMIVNNGEPQMANSYTTISGEITTVSFQITSGSCGSFELVEMLDCSDYCPSIEAVATELSICSGEEAILSVNTFNTNPTDVLWSNGDVGAVITLENLINNTCHPILQTFTATTTSIGTCETEEVNFEVTVYPKPDALATVEVDEDNCSIVASACPDVNILYQMADGTLVSSSTFSADQGSGLHELNFIFTSTFGCGQINIPASIECEALVNIDSFVWTDLNGNGLQDEGEPGIAGVVINLLDENGNIVATVTTDENGGYTFNDVPDGVYVIEAELPNGYTFTLPNQGNENSDSDVNLDGVSDEIQLNEGDNVSNIDIGFVPICINLSEVFATDQNNCLGVGEVVSVEVNEVTLGAGEIILYILYTNPEDILGSIVGQNLSPMFMIQQDGSTNYYVGAVIGPD